MKIQRTNHLAIVVMTIGQMALAGVWYEVVVKDIWGKISGVRPEDFEGFQPINYIWPFFAALALGYILSYLLQKLEADSVGEAVKISFFVWTGFLFFEMAALNVMSLRPLAITFVDQGLTLIKYLLLAYVLMIWRK